ncbi:CLUMA_CG002436, isoform A [Clunio marinus]|uniref:CLUMA_CG002436, isoform A n=1 Tax=Clunio marinus TaxID=568069 RepID=A0A1J1HR42_9DIPT|nr:CLUMA_CG002436, isoform A [Clunio marinus]
MRQILLRNLIISGLRLTSRHFLSKILCLYSNVRLNCEMYKFPLPTNEMTIAKTISSIKSFY